MNRLNDSDSPAVAYTAEYLFYVLVCHSNNLRAKVPAAALRGGRTSTLCSVASTDGDAHYRSRSGVVLSHIVQDVGGSQSLVPNRSYGPQLLYSSFCI